MPIITLTTDFGLGSGYVGMMKGVILGIAPDARIVDLSHELPAQDVSAAALLLSRSVPYFPAGTIHLAVVDPGVGSARRPLLVAADNHYFVGPDNGLFTGALSSPAAKVWLLDRPEFWLSPLSRTFHGRDVFAPIAARLANGALPGELASPAENPVLLSLPKATRIDRGHIIGNILEIDRFGNLLTNIPVSWLGDDKRWLGRIAGVRIAGPVPSYESVARGELLLLESSNGHLEIALRDGSAAAVLSVGVGAELELEPA